MCTALEALTQKSRTCILANYQLNGHTTSNLLLMSRYWLFLVVLEIKYNMSHCLLCRKYDKYRYAQIMSKCICLKTLVPMFFLEKWQKQLEVLQMAQIALSRVVQRAHYIIPHSGTFINHKLELHYTLIYYLLLLIKQKNASI